LDFLGELQLCPRVRAKLDSTGFRGSARERDDPDYAVIQNDIQLILNSFQISAEHPECCHVAYHRVSRSIHKLWDEWTPAPRPHSFQTPFPWLRSDLVHSSLSQKHHRSVFYADIVDLGRFFEECKSHITQWNEVGPLPPNPSRGLFAEKSGVNGFVIHA
jgi:hypothetical protein